MKRGWEGKPCNDELREAGSLPSQGQEQTVPKEGSTWEPKVRSKKFRCRHSVMLKAGLLPSLGPAIVSGSVCLTLSAVFSTECLTEAVLCVGVWLLRCFEKQGRGSPRSGRGRTPFLSRRVCLRHLFHTKCKPGGASHFLACFHFCFPL